MKISTVAELLRHIYQLDIDGGSYCFRGETNNEWTLLPSVYRKKIGFKRYQTVILESTIISFMQKQTLPHIYTEHPLEILMICQHYGFPTRLLDFSNDVLTALFFACNDTTQMDKDGILYVLNKNAYDKFDFTSEATLQSYKTPQLIETSIINPRTRAQSGCFLFWSTNPLDKTSTESYDLQTYNNQKLQDFEKINNETPLSKIIINKNFKNKILKELENTYGITKESLYLNNCFSRDTEAFYTEQKRKFFKLTEHLTETREGI